MRAQYLGLMQRKGSKVKPVLRLVFENTGPNSKMRPHTEMSLEKATTILNGNNDRDRAGRSTLSKRGIDLDLLGGAHQEGAYFMVRSRLKPTMLDELPQVWDVATKQPILPNKKASGPPVCVDLMLLESGLVTIPPKSGQAPQSIFKALGL